ncbi:MAG: hypothetical protein ACREMY_02380 [bacterium]
MKRPRVRDGIKFEPTKGNALAAFTSGADCSGLGGQTLNITGSFLGVPHGATLEFTEASAKPTLSLGATRRLSKTPTSCG